jgi:lipopolysaccharide export system permease protein
VKLSDRYIVRQFITTALFALGAVVVVFIVIDAFEKLDDFIDKQANLRTVALYYLYFMPEIIKLIIPVALLLASLFVTARMSTQNEWTALKSGGMSLYRLMVPFIVVAFIVSAVMIYFNGWVVPQANTKKYGILRSYLRKDLITASGSNIYLQDSPTRFITLGYYDEQTTTASRVSVQMFDAADATHMVERIDAARMAWDSTGRHWTLLDGSRRLFGPQGNEQLESVPVLPMPDLHFDPETLRKKQEKPDEMDYRTMQQFIEDQKRAGQEVSRWEVDFYSKISFPFASLIVVLFGVPFASVKRRGGMGMQLGISLLVCFLYLILMKVSQVFGYNGDIPPLLTAWLANIAFFAGAVVVTIKAPK